MKVYIELIDGLEENEVIIRCSKIDETVTALQKYVTGQMQAKSQLVFYKDNQEYFLPLQSILFFETSNENVYAHTATDAYMIKYRLYELEEMLPIHFVRAAKSCILNINHVHSITRNLTSASKVEFMHSHKQVYISRHYYQAVNQRMRERKQNEK